MAFNFLFKAPKARQFHYEPLFYNAEKEALEERIKRITGEINGHSAESYKSGFTRGTLRNYYKKRRRSDRYTTLRLLIIIIILVLLSYYLILR